MQRYEREHPGDLFHIDIKSLARFRKVGHRITGDRQQGRSYGVGYDKVHVAVDDATRLAYVEVLADGQKPTVIGFLSRAVTWFNAQGVESRRVMSDNGPAYVSKAFAKACRTRPYTPRTNGKAERYGLRPTASTSRPCARNGPMPWSYRTPRSASAGCPATCRSLTGSGITQPWAGFHLSSGSLSCSAHEPGETQHLAGWSDAQQHQLDVVQRQEASQAARSSGPWCSVQPIMARAERVFSRSSATKRSQNS